MSLYLALSSLLLASGSGLLATFPHTEVSKDLRYDIGQLSSEDHGLRYRRKPYLDTPFKDSLTDTEKVIVADPTHPLYGKSFQMAFCSSEQAKHIFVFFYDSVLLRLPKTAIHPPKTSMTPTKLNLEAIKELVEQAMVCGICESNQPNSGVFSRANKKNKSSLT